MSSVCALVSGAVRAGSDFRGGVPRSVGPVVVDK